MQVRTPAIPFWPKAQRSTFKVPAPGVGLDPGAVKSAICHLSFVELHDVPNLSYSRLHTPYCTPSMTYVLASRGDLRSSVISETLIVEP